MTNTVTINGHTYTDDGNANTGMANGGHRYRLLPLVSDVVVVAADVAAKADTATTQAGLAAQKANEAGSAKDIATEQAVISTTSAQTAANGVLAQLTALKTQCETARDQAIAGLGAADQSQNLVVLSAGIQIALDLIKQALDLAGTAKADAAGAVAATVTAETNRAVDLTLLSAGIQAALDMIGIVARQVSGGTVQLAAGSAAEPSLSRGDDRDTGIMFPAANVVAIVTAGLERLRVDASGYFGFGTSAPSGLVDINDNKLRVRTAQTPASAGAAGNQGEIAWDANYIYVCTATNTWKRAALASW